MQLPFPALEWWRVTWGWNANSHQGRFKFCWDFEPAQGAARGAAVHACAPGTVVEVEPGGWFYVEHATGENLTYMHCENSSLKFKVGDTIHMGQPIAGVGDTGTSAGNFHLHMALANNIDGKEDLNHFTVESQFIDYDVSTDGGLTFTHVNVGVPLKGQWIRRSSTWSGWRRREEGSIIGSPAAVSRTPSITDVFARGLDNRLWQDTHENGKGWSGWHRHDDNFILGASPAAMTLDPVHLGVFACDVEGKVFHKTWLSGGWSKWEPREGGQIKGAPAAGVRSTNITDVFGRGMDNRLWQNTFVKGKGWSGWFRHEDGLELGASPAVDLRNPLHLQIFACDAHGNVFHKWSPGSGGWNGWSSWQQLEGGQIKGAPAVISRTPAVTDVFGRGLSNGLWQNTHVQGKGWTGWFRHEDGFVLGAAPVADSRNSNHLQLFGIDPSGKVHQNWWPDV
jgi:hypothetical protein